MRIKSSEWCGGELCALMHRKNFLQAVAAVGDRDLPDRYLYELRLVEKALIGTTRTSWISILIAQAGESWISSFFGYLGNATGRWCILTRANGAQAIEYELKGGEGV